MVDQTDNMMVYGDGYGPDLFGQVYHTPVSQLWFRLSGISSGDYVNLSGWFQCVYSVHASPNSDRAGSGYDISIIISGTYPTNCGPIIIFDRLSGVHNIHDFQAIGHKAEYGRAFNP